MEYSNLKMADESFSNNSSLHSLNDSLNMSASEILKLRNQNEENQQTIYTLRRELDSKNALYQEVKELLEEASGQQSEQIDKMIQDITIKHNEERKAFKKQVEELEEDLISKMDKIQVLENYNMDLKSQIKMPPILEESTEITFHEKKEQECDVTEFITALQEKDERIVQLEQDKNNFQTQISELRDIIEGLRKCLDEKIQVIESTQEELIECRLELNTLKTAPDADTKKGNSLFAEVEDRRKMMMEKMNSMRSSYLEMKKSYELKENEIRILKTERAALIRKWEEASNEAVEQEITLVDAYRKRILDLENRLKDEQKKIKQFQNEQQAGSNISYFQILLDAKKKEIEELQAQIENESIRSLLKEERTCKLGNRLRYWKYKAMSLEADLSTVLHQIQNEPNSSVMESLQIIKKKLNDRSLKINDMEDEIELSLKPEIIDETPFSLESLLQPKLISQVNSSCSVPSEMSLTSLMDNSSLDSNQSIIATCDTNSLNTVCKSLNFTKDMSLTQAIEAIDLDTTLAATNEEDLKNFLPISTSSSLQETYKKLDPVSKSCDTNKENIASGSNFSILKSSLSKSSKDEREKKTLRFTEDTAVSTVPKVSYIRRLKDQQRKYPLVHISNKPDK